MINRIDITNPKLATDPITVFPRFAANDIDGEVFDCPQVDGLGPVAAQLNFAKVGLSDGTLFNSQTLPDRIITFYLESTMMGAPVSTAKRKLKLLFNPGDRVGISVWEDWIENKIIGIVETCEPEYIHADRKTALEASVHCPSPFFIVAGGEQKITENVRPRERMQVLVPASQDLKNADTQIVYSRNVYANEKRLTDIRCGAYTISGEPIPGKGMRFSDVQYPADATIQRVEFDSATQTAKMVTNKGTVDLTAYLVGGDWDALKVTDYPHILRIDLIGKDGLLEFSDYGHLTITWTAAEAKKNGV